MIMAGGDIHLDTVFENNWAIDQGGGAFWAHLASTTVAQNCEIHRSLGFMGAAIASSIGAHVTMKETRIHHNGGRNMMNGGAWGVVFMWNAKVTIRENCKIDNNVIAIRRPASWSVWVRPSTLRARTSARTRRRRTAARSTWGMARGSPRRSSNIPDEGLADPKVRLFDMNIYHNCPKMLNMDGSEGSRTTTAFGYGWVRKNTDFMVLVHADR